MGGMQCRRDLPHMPAMADVKDLVLLPLAFGICVTCSQAVPECSYCKPLGFENKSSSCAVQL